MTIYPFIYTLTLDLVEELWHSWFLSYISIAPNVLVMMMMMIIIASGEFNNRGVFV